MSSVEPAAPKLALFTRDACGFCREVRLQINDLGVPIEVIDVADDKHREELVQARGRSTVPVLRIDDGAGPVRWMPESREIIRYVRVVAGKPDPTPPWFDKVRDGVVFVPWGLLVAGMCLAGVARATVLAVGFAWLAFRQIQRALRGDRGRAVLGAVAVVVGVVAVTNALGWLPI